MLANPVNLFVNNVRQSFTYEPGLYPFNFMPYDCGMSSNMQSNLLLWADNEEHAKAIVIAMLSWWLDQEQYTDNSLVVETRKAYERRVVQGWYNNRHLIKCTPVPTNQMYKLSWADNDKFI